MCDYFEEDEDEYEECNTTECAVLTLNSRDIYELGKGGLYPGTNVQSSNAGYMTVFGSKMVFTNIDLQRVIGPDMWQKYDIFSIDLKIISTTYSGINNCFNFTLNKSFTSLSIYLQGLDFISNNNAPVEQRAHMTNLSDLFNLSSNNLLINQNTLNLQARYVKQVQTDCSSYLFRKHSGVRPLTLTIGPSTRLDDMQLDQANINGAWNIAPPLFTQYVIRPVA
jgi:hypothetical protein